MVSFLNFSPTLFPLISSFLGVSPPSRAHGLVGRRRSGEALSWTERSWRPGVDQAAPESGSCSPPNPRRSTELCFLHRDRSVGVTGKTLTSLPGGPIAEGGSSRLPGWCRLRRPTHSPRTSQGRRSGSLPPGPLSPSAGSPRPLPSRARLIRPSSQAWRAPAAPGPKAVWAAGRSAAQPREDPSSSGPRVRRLGQLRASARVAR